MMSKFLYLFLMLLCGGIAYGQPVFKGGEQALASFLADKIVYPEYSRQNCISATLQVSFRLDKYGAVSNTTIVSGPGIDLDDEALRVIKLTSGKWVIPVDYDPNTAIILPVRFDRDRTRCGTVSAVAMNSAITAYKGRQELENAVTNYYINKYAGKADTRNEASIIALKQQLGFDDDLISEMLKNAGSKLKQGDTDGACTDWKFIRNIGSNKADAFLAKYCK